MSRCLALAAVIAVACCLALPASGGAAGPPYRILIVGGCGNDASDYSDYISGLTADPDVGTVDVVDGNSTTPSVATMETYDLVISASDCDLLDPDAYGDNLADYLDAGGLVLEYAYDNWNGDMAAPQGRYQSGGYAPLVPGDNVNNDVTLGTYDASAPIMANVTSLGSSDNTAPALAAGATLVASWDSGDNAVATKGRAASVTGAINNGAWSGDFPTLALNWLRQGVGASSSPSVPVSRPVVTGLSPATGVPGTAVGISGTNFNGVTQVLFGGVPASFVVDGFNHISATAPAGPTGTIDVQAVNAAGTSAAGSADQFAYAAQPAGLTPGTPSRTLICAHVPSLLRHTYRGAKKILGRSGCLAPGHVLTHTGHARHHRRSHVKSQTPAAGEPLYSDAPQVSVRLG